MFTDERLKMSGSWRKYTFFDKDIVNEDVESVLGSKPSCAVAEGGMLIFGDEAGTITIADKNFQILDKREKAFHGPVLAIYYLFDTNLNNLHKGDQRKQYLFALGNDSKTSDSESIPGLSNYLIKIFNVSDLSRPVQSFCAFGSGISFPPETVPTSFSVLSSGLQIAVGFSSGSVLLFQGHFTKDNSRSQSPQVLLASHPHPISGIYFCELGATAQPKHPNNMDVRTRLFVVLDSGKPSSHALAHPQHTSSSSEWDGGGGEGENPEHGCVLIFDTSFSVLGSSSASTSASSVPPTTTSLAASFGVVGGAGLQLALNSVNAPPNQTESGTGGIGGGASPTSTTVMNLSLSSVPPTATLVPFSRRRPVHILDERGAGLKCSSLMRATRELVLGRSEGVFSYSVEDRGGAAGFEGEKQCVSAVGRYVLVANLDEKTRRNNITIYDMRNKFISFSGQIASGEKVSMMMYDGGMAYLLTSSFMLIRFRERDTASKIDVLLKKSLFPLAISLATEEQSDVTEIMQLYKQYGDYLYKKNDFDSAIQQYIAAIGYVQPSYVIRRFLDLHRIGNLVLYLEKLQERKLSSLDQSSLLLTCYTKMKDEKKIATFISNLRTLLLSQRQLQAQSSESSTPSPDPSLMIDVAASIQILRQANFLEFAMQLASLFEEHDLYLNLLLASIPHHQSDSTSPSLSPSESSDLALSYILNLARLSVQPQSLSPSSLTPTLTGTVLLLLLTYGRTLLSMNPLATTSLITSLCTGSLPAPSSPDPDSKSVDLPPSYSSVQKNTPTAPPTSLPSQNITFPSLSVEQFLPIFAGDDLNLQALIENVYFSDLSTNLMTNLKRKKLPKSLTHTLMEIYLKELESRTARLDELRVITQRKGPNVSQLRLQVKESEKELKGLEDRILSMLDGVNSELDESHAMLLMASYSFERGEKVLLEKRNAVDLLLRIEMERAELSKTANSSSKAGPQAKRVNLKSLLRQEGRKDPELFMQVLTFYIREAQQNFEAAQQRQQDSERKNQSDDEEDREEAESRWDNVLEILDTIEKESILSPSQVLSLLSAAPSLPLSIVQSFFTKSIKTLFEDVSSLESVVGQSRESVDRLVQEEYFNKQLDSRLKKLSGKPSAQASSPKRSTSKDDRSALSFNPPGNQTKNKSRAGTGTGGFIPFEDDDDDDEEDVIIGRRAPPSLSLSPANSSSSNDTGLEEDDERDLQLERQEKHFELKKWERIRKSQLERSQDHEGFFSEVEHSLDGFSAVASYFGKSLVV